MSDNIDRMVAAGEIRPAFAERRMRFVRGHLLAADDRRQEQGAVGRRNRRLGSAIGGGVAHGLEVRAVPDAVNVLQIEAGLAITGFGEPLVLDAPLRLRLASAVERPAAGGLVPYGVEADFALDKGEGYYLLSLVPDGGKISTQVRETGRNDRRISGGTGWQQEGVTVQVNRIPAAALPSALRGALSAADTPGLSRARSLLAKLCFGDATDSARLGQPPDDLLQTAGLATPERVALALIAWSEAGVCFIDRWSVRRSVAPDTRTPAVSYGSANARRTTQPEAMQRQFQEHLDELLLTLKSAATDVVSLVAGEWFVWLPAVGVLPRANTESGLSTKLLFSKQPAPSVFLAHAVLDDILRESAAFPPIDLTAKSPSPIWLYQLVEDRNVVVYASGHLPPANPARLDLARYDASFYPEGEQ